MDFFIASSLDELQYATMALSLHRHAFSHTWLVSGGRLCGNCAEILHRNAGVPSSSHHVGRASPAWEGNHQVGGLLLQHFLIADRPRRLAVKIPLRWVNRARDLSAVRPFVGEPIRATRATMDQQGNRIGGVDDIEHGIDLLAPLKISATADQNDHS